MKKEEFVKNHQKYLKEDKKRSLIFTPILAGFLIISLIFAFPLRFLHIFPESFWFYFLVTLFIILIPLGTYAAYHQLTDHKTYKLICAKYSCKFSKQDCKIVTTTDKCPYCGKQILK